MDFALNILLLLFVVALLAGWVDAVAGGGGLITIPVLLLVGIPPASAIATNKLQGSFGTFTATLYFIRQRTVSLRDNAFAFITVCVGSIFGGWVLTQVNASYLQYLVPVLLIATGLYFLLFASNLDEAREARMQASTFNTTVAPGIGFYDGFFGPGAGSFLATAFVTLRGMPIRQATAHAKLLNFAGNLSALVYFVLFGNIVWLAGIAMIGGQILGAYIGARVAFQAGARIIRPITILVCFVMSVRVLWDLSN